MKIHYIADRVCRTTACGLLVTFLSPLTTTWKESVTCKSCLKCFDSYTERYNAITKEWENTTNEDLLVKVIENSLRFGARDLSLTEVITCTQVLLQRLVEAGFIRKPDRVEIDWY